MISPACEQSSQPLTPIAAVWLPWHHVVCLVYAGKLSLSAENGRGPVDGAGLGTGEGLKAKEGAEGPEGGSKEGGEGKGGREGAGEGEEEGEAINTTYLDQLPPEVEEPCDPE